jgi:hypothetical protein
MMKSPGLVGGGIHVPILFFWSQVTFPFWSLLGGVLRQSR